MMLEQVYFLQQKEQRSHAELNEGLKWKKAFTQLLNSSTELNCSDLDLLIVRSIGMEKENGEEE
jgi:hypothetical protein